MAAFLALDNVPQPPQIECRVEASYADGGVHLRGRVSSAVDAAGHYWLEINQIGGGGSATIAQAGAFQVKAQQRAFLGSANLDAGPGMRLVARFTVQASGKEKSCVA